MNAATTLEPRWMRLARGYLGVREIPGPKHAAVILQWAKALGARKLGIAVNDDETPWCGVFMAHVMSTVGQTLPPIAVRAKSWLAFGFPLPEPVPGAVLVFQRPGGGHVGLYAAEDRTHYWVLGGNQSNAVSIARIEKARCVGVRWPNNEPLLGSRILVAANGQPVSKNEA